MDPKRRKAYLVAGVFGLIGASLSLALLSPTAHPSAQIAFAVFIFLLVAAGVYQNSERQTSDIGAEIVGWLKWMWFGWFSLFALVVCAWLAFNYSDHQKTGLSLLFGVAACILGALSIGFFLAWIVIFIRNVIDFMRWAWRRLGRLVLLPSKLDSQGLVF